MTDQDHKQRCQESELQIKFAIDRLADKYPFHAKTLEQFDIQCRNDVETMAVSAHNNRVHLFHNPDFVAAITLAELVGVLLHEVHHVVFGHLTLDSSDYPDDWALTVAQEVTVNEFVKEPLPLEPVMLEQFPSLPAMESTQQRYERLRTQTDRPQILKLEVKMLCSLDDGSSSGSDNESPNRSNKRMQEPGSILIIDDHGVWPASGADSAAVENSIRTILQNAAIELGEANVPESIGSVLPDWGIGTVSGDGRFRLETDDKGQINWIRQLRRYVGHCLQPKPDFKRPSRRFPKLVGVIPGRRRQGGRPRVMAVIDTSGSMTDEIIRQIDSELARLAGDFEVLVVECDVKILQVYRYRRLDFREGYGGTDLRPPLQPDFLREQRPDLIVYFTDGNGPAPPKPPRIPVIWCLTPDGQAPASWGRVIQMETN